MPITFRMDASLTIGTGHVVRCLTLARELAIRGNYCLFLCRNLSGNLNSKVEQAGFPVVPIRAGAGDFSSYDPEALLPDWREDAERSAAALRDTGGIWDWIVVDHYGLDAHWEHSLKGMARHRLVIDDIANRDHFCTLLLDQNLGRSERDYLGRVNSDCRLLLGTDYALLREEFRQARVGIAQTNYDDTPKQLLITMGGIDAYNATADVLSSLALMDAGRGQDLAITVVMGAQAPYIDQVRDMAHRMPNSCRVLIDVSDMASLMTAHHLGIGTAGSTSWERCCVGLPAILYTPAANQRPIARALHEAGAAIWIDSQQTSGWNFAGLTTLVEELLANPATLRTMSNIGKALVDGCGAQRVADAMEEVA